MTTCAITECYQQVESGALLCPEHHEKFSDTPASLRLSCRWCLSALTNPTPEEDAFCSAPCKQSWLLHENYEPGDLGYIPKTSAEAAKHRRLLKKKTWGTSEHTAGRDTHE